MIKVFEAFAGIGAQHQALKNLGIDFEVVGISEFDKQVSKAYELIHGKTNNVGDIKHVDEKTLPDFDLFTYSFPCQDLSVAGKGKGMDFDSGTRSSLVWDAMRIIKYKKPKYCLMENVAAILHKNNEKNFGIMKDFLKSCGYTNHVITLNSKDFGIPQSRNRTFMVSIRGNDEFNFDINKFKQNNKTFEDIRQKENIPESCYKAMRSKSMLDAIDKKKIDVIDVKNHNAITKTITTKQYRWNVSVVKDENGLRLLTPLETLRLMGFDDDVYNVLKENGFSNDRIYKFAGNSIVVNVLMAIFAELFL